MSKIAEKADSLAVERAARRGRKRVARSTVALSAVGGEEPPKKIGSPVPKPKPRTSAQRKGTVQAQKGFSAEIEEARKILTKKGMSDAEKYAAIATIGGMSRAIPPLAKVALGSMKTIFRFIRHPKTESVNTLKKLVKEYKTKGGDATKWTVATDTMDTMMDTKKSKKNFPKAFNKGGTKKMNPPIPKHKSDTKYDPIFLDVHVAKYRKKHSLQGVSREDIERMMAMSQESTKVIVTPIGEEPEVAKGGMIKKNKRPQMMKGGAYKGKKHSYAAGGKVNKLNF